MSIFNPQHELGLEVADGRPTRNRWTEFFISREMFDNLKNKNNVLETMFEDASPYVRNIITRTDIEVSRVLFSLFRLGRSEEYYSLEVGSYDRSVEEEVKYALYSESNRDDFLQYYEIVHDTTSSKNVLLVVLESGFLKKALEDRNNLLMFLKDCIREELSYNPKSSSEDLYKVYSSLRLDENSFRAMQTIASK